MKGCIILIISSFLYLGNAQVSVIHFNSEWNKENAFDISVLKDCDKKNVMICHNEKLKDKHNIISVPTIIVFDEGKEVARFQANILMKLTATKKDIQQEIDKIYLTKFE
tara:strand:+ start:83 stop:409 length:327 start_codon:yes stop_codon:yes gene_type:complete